MRKILPTGTLLAALAIAGFGPPFELDPLGAPSAWASMHAQIERLHHENPKGGLVIQADREARYELLKAVLSAARDAGMSQVAVSTEA